LNKIASFFKSTRVWGLAGTAVVLYFLLFVVLGRIDMSWIMPDTNQIARTLISLWPRMPFFAVQKETVKDANGKDAGQVYYYTVPTRQLTPQELARMGLTNGVAHPARPK
jgi:hypothetical protein